MIFWMPFWIDFGFVFPFNLEPKIQENRSKIDAVMASHVELIFGSIFLRFLLSTWSLRPSFGASGLAPNGIFRIFRKNACRMRFWCQLGSIFLPQIHQNPKKNRSQDASNFGSIFRQILHRCWLDFRSQLGAMLATFSAQEPCKTGLNTRPKRPRPPRASKTSKMSPKIRWGTPPGLVFGANMGALGPFWRGFWTIFGLE